jgi:hypothetical protein
MAIDPPNKTHQRPIHVARWQNFRALLVSRNITMTAAAERLGKLQGQVSHFGGARPIRAIGDQIAAEIETAFGLPEGSLDSIHPAEHLGFLEINESLLEQAEKWVQFEESSLGRYLPVGRLKRLIELLGQLNADGGQLTPAHAAELVDSVRQQQQSVSANNSFKPNPLRSSKTPSGSSSGSA